MQDVMGHEQMLEKNFFFCFSNLNIKIYPRNNSGEKIILFAH